MNARTSSLLTSTLFLALGIVVAPTALDAQEAEGAGEECSAAPTPSTIQSGRAVVGVIVSFPRDIGKVTTVETPEESELRLATPEDLQEVDLAAGKEEGEAPRPIQMNGDENAATVWLNTSEAERGAHRLALKGEAGMCTAEIDIKGAESR